MALQSRLYSTHVEGGNNRTKRTVQGGKVLFETVSYVARIKTNTAEVQ